MSQINLVVGFLFTLLMLNSVLDLIIQSMMKIIKLKEVQRVTQDDSVCSFIYYYNIDHT